MNKVSNTLLRTTTFLTDFVTMFTYLKQGWQSFRKLGCFGCTESFCLPTYCLPNLGVTKNAMNKCQKQIL